MGASSLSSCADAELILRVALPQEMIMRSVRVAVAIVALFLVGLVLVLFVAQRLVTSDIPGIGSRQTDQYFLAVTAVATVLLGAATVWLGWETRRLGLEELADRRLSVRPVVVFDHALPAPNARNYAAQLRNIGSGPALQCRYVAVYRVRRESAFARVSPRFSLARGESSFKRAAYDKTGNIGQADLAYQFFGYSSDGSDVPTNAFLEVCMAQDTLGETWWFARQGESLGYASGRESPPGTHPEKLDHLA
jgi:hypothetical protein